MFEPVRLEDVVPQRLARRLYDIVLTGLHGGPRIVLVYGPPGSGKTTTVRVIARVLGLRYVDYDVYEVSGKGFARTVRSGARVLVHVVGLDEAREREAGILADVLRSARTIVVLEANNGWCPAATRLRRRLGEKLAVLEYRYPSRGELVSALLRICRILGVRCDDGAVQNIANYCGGNIEVAVNDLYAVATTYGEVSDATVNKYYTGTVTPRNIAANIWQALQRYFNAEDYWQARQALEELLEYVELDQAFYWIMEMIPVFMEGSGEKKRAYSLLLLARETLDYTLRTRQWSLYAYVFDYLASIPLVMESKKHRRRRMHAPRRAESYVYLQNALRKLVADVRAKHPLLSSHIIRSFIIEMVSAMHRAGLKKNEIIEKISKLGFDARTLSVVVENLLRVNDFER